MAALLFTYQKMCKTHHFQIIVRRKPRYFAPLFYVYPCLPRICFVSSRVQGPWDHGSNLASRVAFENRTLLNSRRFVMFFPSSSSYKHIVKKISIQFIINGTSSTKMSSNLLDLFRPPIFGSSISSSSGVLLRLLGLRTPALHVGGLPRLLLATRHQGFFLQNQQWSICESCLLQIQIRIYKNTLDFYWVCIVMLNHNDMFVISIQ